MSAGRCDDATSGESGEGAQRRRRRNNRAPVRVRSLASAVVELSSRSRHAPCPRPLRSASGRCRPRSRRQHGLHAAPNPSPSPSPSPRARPRAVHPTPLRASTTRTGCTSSGAADGIRGPLSGSSTSSTGTTTSTSRPLGYARFLDRDNSCPARPARHRDDAGPEAAAPYVGERIALLGMGLRSRPRLERDPSNLGHPLRRHRTDRALTPGGAAASRADGGNEGGGGGGVGTATRATSTYVKDGIATTTAPGFRRRSNYTPPGVVVGSGCRPFRLDANHDGYACG